MKLKCPWDTFFLDIHLTLPAELYKFPCNALDTIGHKMHGTRQTISHKRIGQFSVNEIYSKASYIISTLPKPIVLSLPQYHSHSLYPCLYVSLWQNHGAQINFHSILFMRLCCQHDIVAAALGD